MAHRAVACSQLLLLFCIHLCCRAQGHDDAGLGEYWAIEGDFPELYNQVATTDDATISTSDDKLWLRLSSVDNGGLDMPAISPGDQILPAGQGSWNVLQEDGGALVGERPLLFGLKRVPHRHHRCPPATPPPPPLPTTPPPPQAEAPGPGPEPDHEFIRVSPPPPRRLTRFKFARGEHGVTPRSFRWSEP